MDWNPIETAPPDQWIVAISAGFFEDGLPYRPQLARYDSVNNDWTVVSNNWAIYDDGEVEDKHILPSDSFGATHWMPLPTSSPKME